MIRGVAVIRFAALAASVSSLMPGPGKPIPRGRGWDKPRVPRKGYKLARRYSLRAVEPPKRDQRPGTPPGNRAAHRTTIGLWRCDARQQAARNLNRSRTLAGMSHLFAAKGGAK